MPLYHVSVFYGQRGDREGGWTTNFWNIADDEPALVARINTLVAALNKLAGAGCNVNKARYAVSPGFRIGDEIQYNYKSGLSTDSSVNADYQTTAIGIRLLASTVAGKYGVTIWLSGNNDGAVINAGRLSPSFVTDPDWKRVATILTTGANGWVLQVKNKARAKKNVKSIGVAGAVVCEGHGFTGANLVTISRVSGFGRPRGSFVISNITTNGFDLNGYSNPDAAALRCRFAIAREDTYTQVPIGSAIPKRATSHKRGRPTDLLTGKATKAKT